MSDIILQHILLAFLLVLWCLLHSLLISQRLIDFLKSILSTQFAYYRLFYNAFACLSLLPILYFMFRIPATTYFAWPGLYKILQGFLIATGLILLYKGAKHYDMKQFLGLRQIQTKEHRIGLNKLGKLHTDGILRMMRHPWYTAGFLLLWARDISSISLIVNLILSLYLWAGTVLEEKKLKREFGEAYIEFQHTVGMFFPKLKKYDRNGV